jgi:uncharacterized RDD family membrane protein YckC
MTEPETTPVPSPPGEGTSVPHGWTPVVPGPFRPGGVGPGGVGSGGVGPSGVGSGGVGPSGVGSGGFRPGGFPVPPVPPARAADGRLLAEPWERLAAYLIDGVFTFAVLLPVIVAWGVVVFRRTRTVVDRYHRFVASGGTRPPHLLRELITPELVGIAIVVPLGILVSYLYHVTFMHRTGQTPGKRFLKIIVVRADGSAMTSRVAHVRWITGVLAPSLAPYYSYADSLWLLWDKPYRQCLHDKCAETVVVKSTS